MSYNGGLSISTRCCLQIEKRILVFNGQTGERIRWVCLYVLFVGESHTEALKYVQSEMSKKLNIIDIIDAPFAHRRNLLHVAHCLF